MLLWIAAPTAVAQGPGPDAVLEAGKRVRCLAASPFGEWLAAGTENAALIWSVSDWKQAAEIPLGAPAQSIAFNFQSSRLLLGLANGEVVAISTDGWRKAAPSANLGAAVTALGPHPNGRDVAVGTARGSVALMDCEGGKVLWTRQAHGKQVLSVACDRRGGQVSSVGADAKLARLDWATGEPQVSPFGLPKMHETYSASVGHLARLLFIGNKRLVYTVGFSLAEYEQIYVVDYEGRPQKLLAGHFQRYISPIAASADGRLLATPCYKDHLLVWGVSDGVPLLQIDNVPPPAALCLSAPLGPQFVAAGIDNRVRVYGLQMGVVSLPIPEMQILITAPEDLVGGRDVVVRRRLTEQVHTIEAIIVARNPLTGVTVNGKPVEFTAAPPDVQMQYATMGRASTISCPWAPAKDAQLIIKATDNRGFEGCYAIRAMESGGAVAEPTKWAVIVGVGDYADPQAPDLTGTVPDARALRELLTDPVRGGFSPERVSLLCDGEPTPPTARNVAAALMQLRRAAPDDVAVFYFSGHGLLLEGQGYLAASDLSLQDALAGAGPARLGLTLAGAPRLFGSEIAGGMLSLTYISSLLNAVPCRNQVMILDSCHSGSAQLGALSPGSGPAFSQELCFGSARGRALLTSSQGSEVSWEWPEKGHGVFTYFLLEALQGAGDRDGDGVVNAHEAFVQTAKAVRDWARENHKQQNPRLIYDIVDDIPLASVAG